MMPEEKAKELVNKMFFSIVDRKNVRTLIDYWDEAKRCALICVDEIIKTEPVNTYSFGNHCEVHSNQFYWQQVKQEIENL